MTTSISSAPAELPVPRPSFELIPPALDKSKTRKARQAIRLMALARKPLDRWQQQSVAILLGETSDGLYACPDYFEWCARQNGKGAILEARALAGLLVFDEMLIGWSAHEYRTAMEGLTRCKNLVRNLGAQDYKDPNLVHVQLPGRDVIRIKFNNSHGEESIERLDDRGIVIGRIKFFARSKGAGRGFSAPIWLLDEVFALTDDHLDAVSPTQLTFPNSQTVYTSTPPLDGETGQPMFELRKRAEAGDPELGGRDWGLRKPDGTPYLLDEIDAAEDQPALDVDDPRLWLVTNPAYGPPPRRITERAMRKDRRNRGRLGFARETLGIWPRQIQTALEAVDMAKWGLAGDVDSEPERTIKALVFAFDVQPGAGRSAIASAGLRVDGKYHAKIVQHDVGTAWVIPRLLELKARYRPLAIMVNSNGPAGALVEAAQAVGLKLTPVNGPEWQRACAAFLTDINEDRLRHCEQEALTDAIQAAARKYVGDQAFYWSRKDSSGDICPLAAATAALHGYRLRTRPARALGALG